MTDEQNVTDAQDAQPEGEAQDAAADTVEPQAQEGAPETETSASNIADLPQWAQSLISELRGENAKHRRKAKEAAKEADAAARKAAEEQGKYKELYDAELAKRQALEAEVEGLKLRQLRARIGQEVGLPAPLIERLAGESEEEIRADAEQLLAALPKAPAGTDANKGINSGKQPARRFTDEAAKREFAARLGINPKYLPD